MSVFDNYGFMDPNHFMDSDPFLEAEFEKGLKECKTPEQRDKYFEKEFSKRLSHVLVAIVVILIVLMVIAGAIYFLKWISGWIF